MPLEDALGLGLLIGMGVLTIVVVAIYYKGEKRVNCRTPGCCTCPDQEIHRCPECNYTNHDKAFLGDHYLCKPSQKKKDIEYLNKCWSKN